jgi:amino acid transporter
MSLRQLLFGRALRSEEQERQRIGALRGIPVLGLDALASAAYGPEAALTVLLALGAMSSRLIVPISAVIIALLLVVFVSYRQTIAAYPGGGGSYTVARANLGETSGLVAAAALTLDYVLNVAVAISAGVGAIISAAPALQQHTLALCLLILAAITVVNLRGVRETGYVFMLPTYAFVLCLGGVLLWGLGAMPAQAAAAVHAPQDLTPATLWVIVHAFAAGCTAMTGVEAVSNGVPIFKAPAVRNAQRTLTAIVLILAALVGGIALLSATFDVRATLPGQPGYESVLSQIVTRIAGRGTVYYVTMTSVVAVLCLSANTSFADFPRLCRQLARDEYLPAEFAHLGRRLVYSHGIVVLATFSALLLIVFGGVTDRLIPLFAVGAFLAFTMSQWGMVQHWTRRHASRWSRARLVNAVGALCTALTLAVISISKFVEGAWITLLLIPALVALFLFVRRNYERIGDEMEVRGPLRVGTPPPPIVIIPLKRLDRVARKSIRFALSISHDVRVVQVRAEDPRMTDLARVWGEQVEEPVRRAGYPAPRLVRMTSSYREVFGPLVQYVRELTESNPRRYVAVVVPEVVQRRWYHFLLHSQRPALLKAYLFLRGGPQVVVINTPWYVEDLTDDDDDDAEEAAPTAGRRTAS